MTQKELDAIREQLAADGLTVREARNLAHKLLAQVERCLGLVASLRNSLEALQGRK